MLPVSTSNQTQAMESGELKVSQNMNRESTDRPNFLGRTVSVSSQESSSSSSSEESSKGTNPRKRAATIATIITIVGLALACIVTFAFCKSDSMNRCGSVITDVSLAGIIGVPVAGTVIGMCVIINRMLKLLSE